MGNFDIEKTLRRIEEKVSKIAISLHVQLKEEKPKETWVRVGVIQDITGWDKEQLRRARENNLIKSKRNTEGYFYLLESLHATIIKKNCSKEEGG